MTKLFISLPGSSEYSVYEENPKGDYHFRFCSFEGGRQLDLRMTPSRDENFSPEMEGGHHFNFPDKSEYIHLIKDTIEHIRKNQLGKIVISRPSCYEIKLNPLSVFKDLIQSYPSACIYLFTHPEVGTWLGATPETLIKKEGNTIKTMSLAGTQKAGEEDKFSEKEKLEQQLVTDFILDTLNSIDGISKVETEGPEIVGAANLLHLRTQFEAEINSDFNLDQLLEKLHPTPAVAGLPRAEALEFIKRMEQYQRGFYSGYFGLSHGGDAHYFVNLRCMEVFPTFVVLFAGGGITADSIAEAEWEETQNKMETLLAVIRNQNPMD